MATGAESEIAGARLLPPAAGAHGAARRRRGRLRRHRASRSIREAQVGDTLTLATAPAAEPLPGYHEPLPLVFAGIYPLRGDDYPELREALDKLHLNDAGFVYEPESSVALGFGFRCGFLGLLHMEIVQERLEREFDLDLIASAPSVEYRVKLMHRDGGGRRRQPGRACRPPGEIETISEPWVSTQVITPTELHRRAHGARDRAARRVREHGVPRPEPGQPALRDAARRAHHRLLRPAQEPIQRLRQPRLRVHRLPARRPRQARRPGQRRARRRAQPDRASRRTRIGPARRWWRS